MKMIENQTVITDLQSKENTKCSTGRKKNIAMKKNDIPPKPYTDYVIYARLERVRLLQSVGCSDIGLSAGYEPNHHDPLEHPRPPKYQDIKLPPYWYSGSITWELVTKGLLSARPTRKHRKREGGLPLKELSQAMSASWKNVDQETADYCKKLAKIDFEKYSELMETIKKEQLAEIQIDEDAKDTDAVDTMAAVLAPNETTPSLLEQDLNFVPEFLSTHFCRMCSYDQATAHDRNYLLAASSTNFSNTIVTVDSGVDHFENLCEPSHRTFSTTMKDSIDLKHSPHNSLLPNSCPSQPINELKRKSLCDDGNYSMKSHCYSPSDIFVHSCADEIHPIKRRASFVCVPEWRMEDAMSLILALSPNENPESP